MTATLGVLESCRGVVEQASLVEIEPGGLEALAAQLDSRPFARPVWRKPPHWWDEGPATAQYVFVLDTLNFCFWGEPKWRIEYQGQTLDGYWALAASLRRAIEQGGRVLDPAWLRQVSRPELGSLLAGTGDLPLLEERAAALRQLGGLLLERYAGQAGNLVAAAGGSAVSLARRVASELPSFDDRATYRGQAVCFYKRAQILCSDLYGAFAGQGPGAFADLEALTAFADYKLPQVLRELGVLNYRPELATRIDSLQELAAGSPEEVEIRASTVVAVERLRQALAARGRPLAAFELDWYLWELGQQAGWRHPYHRTRTIFY
jgi:hypothetical protein